MNRPKLNRKQVSLISCIVGTGLTVSLGSIGYLLEQMSVSNSDVANKTNTASDESVFPFFAVGFMIGLGSSITSYLVLYAWCNSNDSRPCTPKIPEDKSLKHEIADKLRIFIQRDVVELLRQITENNDSHCDELSVLIKTNEYRTDQLKKKYNLEHVRTSLLTTQTKNTMTAEEYNQKENQDRENSELQEYRLKLTSDINAFLEDMKANPEYFDKEIRSTFACMKESFERLIDLRSARIAQEHKENQKMIGGY